jgi:hypothetical protein
MVPGPVVVQAGSAVSDRLRGEANGYNRIHTEPGRLDIEVLQWSQSRFRIAHRYRYRKSTLGWEPA